MNAGNFTTALELQVVAAVLLLEKRARQFM